ncbi:lipocalin-like domain-containing protein [Runella salmonicolor]|uniref:Lipocalin family protein n=1 Tax=Runella salmonicolor TaxID=2950278 RepID=A0ABT1FV22_9BACT|nr:lipocalin family protein [Runella salmonicolor]MCP1385615.1 lipocalin family protein [Runella salmonicolor]
MKKLLLFLLLTGCFCCNKNPDNELVGTWKLISYCKPTGSTNCTPITVPNDKGVFVTFSNDKQFNEYFQNTKPIEYAFLGCGGGSYEIEDKNVRIRAVCMSSSNGRLIELVSLSSKRLVLNPYGTGEYIFEKQ